MQVIKTISHLKEILDLFLEKTPQDIDLGEIKEHLTEIDVVIDVHHIHVWSMDGQSNYATMHVVTNGDRSHIKELVRNELKEHGISHSTLELEDEGERCDEKDCHVEHASSSGHHHHHHHHHHGQHKHGCHEHHEHGCHEHHEHEHHDREHREDHDHK